MEPNGQVYFDSEESIPAADMERLRKAYEEERLKVLNDTDERLRDAMEKKFLALQDEQIRGGQ